jgi:hypothetical protein
MKTEKSGRQFEGRLRQTKRVAKPEEEAEEEFIYTYSQGICNGRLQERLFKLRSV